MHRPHAAPEKRGDVHRVHPDAVRAHDVAAEQSDAFEVIHGRAAVLRAAPLAFEWRFGDVHQDRHAIGARQRPGAFQGFRRESVDRMRRDGRRDERIAFPALDVLLRVRQRRGRRPVIGRREIQDCLAEHAAHAGFLRDARDYVLEVIHVGVRRDSAAQHFQHAQPRAPENEIFSHISRFGGEDVPLQPVVERMVLRDAAEQAHRRVCVAVDHAGQHQRPARVNRLLHTARFRFEIHAFADLGNDVALDRDAAVLDHAKLRVHRDYRAAADEQIQVVPSQTITSAQQTAECTPWPDQTVCRSLSGRPIVGTWYSSAPDPSDPIASRWGRRRLRSGRPAARAR